MNRRTFLKTSLAASSALAFPWIVPAHAVAPSERITLGVIGIGPRCRHVLECLLAEPDMQCMTICDVQASRRELGKKMVDEKYGNTDCTTIRDFRELLARSDIDAVLIATGDHWHALASIMAAKAGKDVYSEKPCGITLADCQALDDTMQRYARVFQAGTQRRSIGNFQSAVQLARSGKLGRIHTLHASIYKLSVRYDWLPEEPLPPKEEVDWDMWLGPAPWRPYNSLYVAGRWREHFDFDSGAKLLDWAAHTADLCQWANNADNTTPVEFVPEDNTITGRYANGVKLIMRHEGWLGLGTCPVRFEGDEGWVETGDSGDIEVHPASLKSELRQLAQKRRGTDAGSHGRNFLDCIRSRAQTNANSSVMRHSHIACHAAAIAWLLKRKIAFDPVAEAFIGDDEANRMRSRAMREPWRV
jgi:predicted dehydrogenase